MTAKTGTGDNGDSPLFPAALLIALTCSTAASAEDQLFGADKALHFSASAAIAGGAYAGAALLGQPVEARLATACGLSLFAGVAKELLDSQGFGSPSPLDLAWDVVGTAVGVAIAWAIDRLFFSPPRESPAR